VFFNGLIDACRNGLGATQFIYTQLERFQADKEISKLITEALIQSLNSGSYSSGYAGFPRYFEILANSYTDAKQSAITAVALDAVVV
jgi:LDH2 family malate/lactate/ureidoglycolate dehydrogenase